MTKSFRASGASTGRKAKAQRLCLECEQAAVSPENKCACGGKIERFDSMAEARKFNELRLLQKAGEISGLRVHPKFELIVLPNERWRHADNTGEKVGHYTADFEYYTFDKQLNMRIRHIIDVKPHRLKKSKKVIGLKVPVIASETALRIKLFEALWGIRVRFVE